MRIYPETNTVYCFAGGCLIKSLDQIDFILKMDNSTKGEAILKAKSLCGAIPKPYTTSIPIMPKQNPSTIFKSYHKSLHNHKPAKEYCESRQLDWRLLEVGYKSQKSVDKWGRGCIIFPLLNYEGEIVSLYGRSIKAGGHYYQSNRSGLYPSYPSKSIEQLILCESIIDAATLQTLDLPLENYGILALYGTNGLTDEHIKSISQCSNLQEIIFALDNDPAGNEATKTHVRTLGGVCTKGVQMSQLHLPTEEDINSLAMSHEHYPALFTQLLEQRKSLTGTSVPVPEKAIAESKLDTTDPHNLIYTTPIATYYIKGGIRCSNKDLQHLKITLGFSRIGFT